MNTLNRFAKYAQGKCAKIMLTFLACLLLLVSVAGCGTIGTAKTGSNDTIVIGGKDFTEQHILANMMKLMIEHHTKLNVKMNAGLDSSIVWNALKDGKIDAYVEYTGTGYLNILKQPPENDPDKVYKIVSDQFKEKYNVQWLKPLGFNNGHVLVMRKEDSQRLGITNLSQLAAKSNNLVFATGQEFLARQDTYPALQRVYNLNFKSIQTMNAGLFLQALQDKKVDVTDVYSTDGKIPSSNLALLTDDKQAFPPYFAAPIIRKSVLKAHPELEETLNKLAGKINDEEMQKLNELVDVQKKDPKVVAEQWLKEHGLI